MSETANTQTMPPQTEETMQMQNQLIIDMRLDDSPNAIKAQADLTFVSKYGEFTIYGFKVIQKDDKPFWVAMPEVRYKGEDGEYKGVKKISVSKLFSNRISEMIISKYKEMNNGNVPF